MTFELTSQRDTLQKFYKLSHINFIWISYNCRNGIWMISKFQLLFEFSENFGKVCVFYTRTECELNTCQIRCRISRWQNLAKRVRLRRIDASNKGKGRSISLARYVVIGSIIRNTLRESETEESGGFENRRSTSDKYFSPRLMFSIIRQTRQLDN